MPATLFPPQSISLSKSGNSNSLKSDAADNLASTPTSSPLITINAADLLAIRQEVADLQAIVQQNLYCHRQSESEFNHERAPKRSNFKGKALDKYQRETYQKLNTFIRQYEKNFQIDRCTQDKTCLAYVGFYISGTPES